MEDTLSSTARGTVQSLSEDKRLHNRDLLKRIEGDGEHLARRSAELADSEEAHAAMKAFMTAPGPIANAVVRPVRSVCGDSADAAMHGVHPGFKLR
ncbi:hypothetical protein ABZT06_45605 [Streptomyces sp. NPDC005483]|uniref:hypothetical protein n=1 Tax=Streptomyces sp. NPDC005483 TaxID=3154882 RepID=UPI0033A0DB8B